MAKPVANSIAYSEMKNPVYQALENQLNLELQWAYSENNLYSASWILLNLTDITPEDLKRIETLVENDLKILQEEKLEKFIKTEFILGLCFGAKIIHGKKGTIPKLLKDYLFSLLNEADKRKWLNSHEFASLVMISIYHIDILNEEFQRVFTWVKSRYYEFLQHHEYEKMIDCLFGLKIVKPDFQLEPDHLQEILKNISMISDETLAKLCIILNKDKQNISSLIQELEKRLENEFKGFLGSSLERALREIVSLLNSNCTPEAIKPIIEAKRKEGQDWAKYIDTEGKKIIIKKVPELRELPKIDPKTHALAYRALNLNDRSSVIMLSKKEFSKLYIAYKSTRKDYVGVRYTEYRSILLIAGITSFLLIMLFYGLVLNISISNYQNFMTFVLEIIQDWSKLFIYGALILPIYFWIWFIRFLYELRNGGEINRLKLFKLMPILSSIIKKILGENEKG
jgi:hypothetical protein